MIPIVEDYLSDLLLDKFNRIKNSPDQLFKILGTTPERVNHLITYMSRTPIHIIKGYPRLPSQLPCVCILLSGEEETQEGLGDYGFEDDNNVIEYTEQLEVMDTLRGQKVTPYVKTTSIPIADVLEVHHDIYMELPTHEYFISNPDLGIIEFPTGSIQSGDSVTVTLSYRATSTELTQVLYESNYRLEAWSTNGDLTVELYHLVKWALLSGRDHLGKDRDLFRQKLGGADFEPAPSYFPEFVYRRALTFWCQFTASAPVEEIGYITDVEVNQEVYRDGGD